MNTFMFPGQGSQKIEMGKEFYENFSVAKNVFEEVDDSLKTKLSSLIFFGDIKDLSLTFNAQPALMTVSIAILKVLEKEFGCTFDSITSYACGHSLGEFTALCASGVIKLSDTARLLRIRGKAMQDAVSAEDGAMAALISKDFSKLDALLYEIKKYGVCEIANHNSIDQIVVSGDKLAVDELIKLSSKYLIKKAILLNVSAPFHCSLMQPAQMKLEEALKEVEFETSIIPVICNYTAQPENKAEKLKENIINQVTKKVRWKETMDFISTNNIKNVIECGSGKVLTGLFKRYSDTINVYNIEKVSDLKLIQTNLVR